MMYKTTNCKFKYRVTIDHVVDGDTVDCSIDLGFDVCIRKRVRLIGIDTPESRTRDLEEKKFGVLSKEKLKQRLSGASRVELRCPKPDSRGKFGRILGELWIVDKDGETNLNEWMCNKGYAVPYTGQNKSKVLQLHLENREKVRDEVN